MANLNFQQPPKSIANTTLQGITTGGFGANSLSGQITPTARMFQSGASNYTPAQQAQLSPNPNAQLSAGALAASSSTRSSIFGGQRPFVERRSMEGSLGSGLMSNMGNFMQTGRAGYSAGSVGGHLSNFHVYGGSGGDPMTPAFNDLSEFPSLSGARGASEQSLPQVNPLQSSASKLSGNLFTSFGMAKQTTSEQPEFTISSEDFPALPGTSHSDATTHSASISKATIDGTGKPISSIVSRGLGAVGSAVGSGGVSSIGIKPQFDNSSNDNSKLGKTGVEIWPDGKVTNIPASMVNNQFGMVGLLTFIRAAKSDPNLGTLALGTDLTSLGLNLNSHESLHPTFAGPFADHPCRAQDVEYNVPPEYLINFQIRDKLSPPMLKKLQEDSLFFIFYTNIGDITQLMAAAELYRREWRYHIEEKIWITRIPGINQYEKNGTKERGTFYYFDPHNWKRLSRVFQIDTEKLDKCPNISAYMNMSGQSV